MSYQLINEGRIFADNYQFYVRDMDVDLIDEIEGEFTIVGSEVENQHLKNSHFVMVTTVADFNDHWLKIYYSEAPPEKKDYEFYTCVSFALNSKKIAIDGIEEEPMLSAKLPTGNFNLFICANNLGIDPTEEQSEYDDAQFKEVNCESYHLFFVPVK